MTLLRLALHATVLFATGLLLLALTDRPLAKPWQAGVLFALLGYALAGLGRALQGEVIDVRENEEKEHE